MAALEAPLHRLEHKRQAISVTTGRGKMRQTLWMTPQPGRERIRAVPVAATHQCCARLSGALSYRLT
jgi:hypothetical protein